LSRTKNKNKYQRTSIAISTTPFKTSGNLCLNSRKRSWAGYLSPFVTGVLGRDRCPGKPPPHTITIVVIKKTKIIVR
jgi:hypothetical protein